MITLVVLSSLLMTAIALAMAVGTLFSGRCLRGSCGGAEVLGHDGEPVSCGACPRRARTAESFCSSSKSFAGDPRSSASAANDYESP